jgi:hypothetical protein
MLYTVYKLADAFAGVNGEQALPKQKATASRLAAAYPHARDVERFS